jgi:hypothetical protein
VQLVQDVAKVVLDGVLSDHQTLSHFTVAGDALNEQGQYLVLALGPCLVRFGTGRGCGGGRFGAGVLAEQFTRQRGRRPAGRRSGEP